MSSLVSSNNQPLNLYAFIEAKPFTQNKLLHQTVENHSSHQKASPFFAEHSLDFST